MKLHLPKRLLTALLAAFTAISLSTGSAAWGEESSAVAHSQIQVQSSLDLHESFAGVIYTLSSTTNNNTISKNIYETKYDSSNLGWEETTDAPIVTDDTNNKWQTLFFQNEYNTLRITTGIEYGYKFQELTLAGLIVEDGLTSPAGIKSLTEARRDIVFGDDGLTAASYFGSDFILNNSSNNYGTIKGVTLKGTQNWHINNKASVTLTVPKGMEVAAEGIWNIYAAYSDAGSLSQGNVIVAGELTNSGSITVNNGATLSFSSTIINNGSITINTGGKLNIDSLDGFLCKVMVDSLTEGTHGYQIGETVYDLMTGTGTLTNKGSVWLNGTDITSSVQAGKYTVYGESTVYEITADYKGDTIKYTGDSGETEDASTFIIHDGAEIKIDAENNSAKVREILLTSKGEGDIFLASNAALTTHGDSTIFKGNLTVQSTLTLGGNKNNKFDLSSLESLVLDGGILQITSDGGTFSNLTITNNGGTFNVSDMKGVADTNNKLVISGTTTLGGKLLVQTTQWRQVTDLGHLTGSGDLEINDIGAGDNSADVTKVTATSLQGYEGAITVTKKRPAETSFKASMGGSVNLKGLTLNDGAIAHFTTNGGNLTIENLTLDDAGAFEIYHSGENNTSSFTTLSVKGSGTLTTSHNEGNVTISNLTNEGDSATLNLISNSPTSKRARFNVDGGDFSGTINVINKASGADRRVVLNLNDADAASEALITLAATNGNAATTALAIGAESVTIGGIADGADSAGKLVIVSGEQKGGTGGLASNYTDWRTLTIDMVSGSQTSSATILEGLNLTKDGAGTQTFSGDVSKFNGAINVQEGKLAFTGTGTTSASSISVDSGASLQLGVNNAITNGSMLAAATGEGIIELSSRTTLNSTTVFNGDLKVSSGGALTIGSDMHSQVGVASLNSIILNGGSVTYSGHSSTIRAVSAVSDSSFTIDDMYIENDVVDVLTIDEVSVNEGVTLSSLANWKHNLLINKMTGAGTVNIKGSGGIDGTNAVGKPSSLSIDSLAGFTGNLSITSQEDSNKRIYSAEVHTGTEDINMKALSFSGFNGTGTAAFIVESNASLNSLSAGQAAVTIHTGKTLTLGGGTADAMASHSIGILNANGGSLTLIDYANLSIDTLKVNHTLSINQGTGVALNISSLNIQEGAVLEAAGDGSIVYIASQNALEGSANGNGYQATREMVLIKGYEWTGTQDNVSSRNGNTYLTSDDYAVLSTIYYVQQGTVTLGGTQATPGVEDATGFNVSKGATLAVAALPSGWNTTNMLTGKVTGDGRIQFTSDITVNHGDTITTFGGELEVTGAGTELTVEGGQSNYVDLSSLSNIVVNNGAQITYHATPQGREEGITSPHLQKLSVESGTGIFHFKDSDEGKTLYIGEVSIHAGATMQMTSSWQDSPITIQKLTTGGEGTDVSKLEVYSPGGNSPSSGVLNIQSLKDFSGELIFIKNSDKSLTATVNTGLEGADFKSLMVTNSNGTMGFTFNVQGDTSIDLVSLDSGTVTIYEGKTLTLGNGEVASTHNIGTLNAGEGASITLNTGATLNAFAKGTGTVILKGSGIYNLERNTASNVSGLDQATWTGTVKINDTNLSIADLSTFGNANSTISVSKIQGELPTQTTEQTIQSHIILEPVSGYSCFDLVGTSAANLTFTGKISGSGNMGTAENSAAGHKITFAGDVTDWTGIYWASQASTITYSGNAKVINNEITAGAGKTSTVLYKNTTGMIVKGNINNQQWTNGTLNLQILNENNATGTVVFTGAVVKGTTNLTVEENASAEFTNASVNLNTVDVKEGATLSFATLNAQTVSLGTAATITKAEGATAATMSKVQMSSAGIVSTDKTGATKGSLSDAELSLEALAAEASFTIKDMSLSNVTIAAANAETKVNLSGVTAIGNGVNLSMGSFTMTDKVDLGEAVGTYSVEGKNTASFTTSQLSGITLNNAEGASLTVNLDALPESLTMGQTYDTLTIVLDGFSMDTTVAYEAGKGLIFAEDSWLGRMLADQNAEYVNAVDSPEVSSIANNNTVTVTYTAMTGGNVGTIITITGLTIPEPTTSTLSLLALAGLAARRRRQH